MTPRWFRSATTSIVRRSQESAPDQAAGERALSRLAIGGLQSQLALWSDVGFENGEGHWHREPRKRMTSARTRAIRGAAFYVGGVIMNVQGRVLARK